MVTKTTRGDSIKGTADCPSAGDGAIPVSPLHVCDLQFGLCPKPEAVKFIRQYHSRLPNCQNGPWTHAFWARYNSSTYATALWNNPSGRCLPRHWRELRRMACGPGAPRNTASCFLAWMVRWFQRYEPEHEKLISYQDTEVHTGTIYRAAGWIPEWTTQARIRNRSGLRAGTTRKYRSNLNGEHIDAVSKIRWARHL